jgi:uncharacterized membrane protein YedE/YeeE
LAVLAFPVELPLALFVYIGYQLTFSLGNYLVRCETLLMVSVDQLRKLDVAKQAGYLLGMGAAWAIYSWLAASAHMQDRTAQVVALHWVLVVVEILVIAALWRSFHRQRLLEESSLLTR